MYNDRFQIDPGKFGEDKPLAPRYKLRNCVSITSDRRKFMRSRREVCKQDNQTFEEDSGLYSLVSRTRQRDLNYIYLCGCILRVFPILHRNWAWLYLYWAVQEEATYSGTAPTKMREWRKSSWLAKYTPLELLLIFPTCFNTTYEWYYVERYLS